MPLQHILLIDDDPEDAAFFSDAISAVNKEIAIAHASAGHHAIQLLLESQKTSLPDLVFMDINMPVMDGWETLREIKRMLAAHSLPIVMLSSGNIESVGLTPEDLGVAAFMTKFDSLDALKDALVRLFERLFP